MAFLSDLGVFNLEFLNQLIDQLRSDKDLASAGLLPVPLTAGARTDCSGGRDSMWICHVGGGGPSTWALIQCLPKYVNRKLEQSRTARTQTENPSVRCQPHKQWLTMLPHSATMNHDVQDARGAAVRGGEGCGTAPDSCDVFVSVRLE